MKRKLGSIALSIVSAFAFIACSSDGGAAETTSQAAAGETTAAAQESGSAAAEQGGEVSAILVTMDGLDNHWANVNRGAEDAAKEFGVKYQWMAPDKKDTALQIEMLNNAIAANPTTLIVAAVDPNAIVATLQEAESKGIKVMYVDSTANYEALAQFTTDNYAAARKAGEEMLKGLQEKNISSGKIGIVAFSNATMTSTERENGFRDALKDSGFELLETQYGNSEVAASQAAAENFITQGIVGLYGNNEPGAVGVGNAAAANKDWDGVVIGFDASEATLDLVDNGSLYSVIAQNPYKMGYEAIKAAKELAEGKTLAETKVDTGASVVTKENSADFRANK